MSKDWPNRSDGCRNAIFFSIVLTFPEFSDQKRGKERGRKGEIGEGEGRRGEEGGVEERIERRKCEGKGN